MSEQMSPQQLQAVNANIRGLVLGTGVEMFQKIFSRTVLPASENVINISPRYVGLIRGFLVKCRGTINNAGAGTLTLTDLGASNFLSKITFTDLSNTVRIQTTGWHIALINSAKQPLVFGGAYAPNVPMGYGNNWTVCSAPTTIATTADGVVQMFYYVPCSYSKDDLRGAVFAQVVNATANLQLEINPTPCAISTGDGTLAIYKNSVATATGWKAATPVEITVYQDYLDQLPRDNNGGYVLPPTDLQTIYELKNTALQGFSVGQDFGVPFANYRTFVSATVVLNNGGVLNVGSDVNYWALRTANSTELFNVTPEVQALKARNAFFADPPKGVYYFDFRNRPINTQQFGNTELVLNPSVVNANAVMLVGFEDFATASQVAFASSLPTGS